MRYVHSNAHIREMEPVAQGDEGDGDDVMRHKLLEVLPTLLQAQKHDQSLMKPVRRLEQIVELEAYLVGLVRECFVHAAGVEIPHRRATHHIQTRRSQEQAVQHRVRLLYEAGLLPARPEPIVKSERTKDFLADEISREREDDGVESYEGNIPRTLAILPRAGAVTLYFVGEKDEMMDNVGLRRIDGV